MVQDIVVGTLSTLNTLVSPLAPATLADSQTYHFEIEANPLVQAQCHVPGKLPKLNRKSEVDVRFESGSETHFTAVFKIRLCTTENGYQTAIEKVNLPIELLDEKFLLKLPAQASYVVSGIPSEKTPGSKNRLKITRLPSAGDLNPIRVEWIPDHGFETHYRPLTVWISKNPGSFASIRGYDAKSLRWRRLEFAYKNPLLRRPFAMTGELSRIEKEQ